MSFAKWKGRNASFREAKILGLASPLLERLCKSAYKAGERAGRKDMERLSMSASELGKAIAEKEQEDRQKKYDKFFTDAVISGTGIYRTGMK